MKKEIINLFLSRIFISLINFALLIFSSRLLGAESRGIINLFVVQLSFVLLIAELFSGPVIVYLYHRINTTQLYSISRFLGCIMVVILYFALELTVGVVNEGFIIFPIIGMLNILLSNKQLFLLANKKNNWHNLLITIQPILFFAFFILLYFINSENDVYTFFGAWIISLIVSNIISLFIKVDLNLLPKRRYSLIIKLLIRRSKWIILSNILHLLGARIVYFYIEKSTGIKDVGIFGTAISITEALLLLSVSVSSIIYAETSKEGRKSIFKTLQYAGIAFYVSLLGLIILANLPQILWTKILGEDFLNIKYLIAISGPVILITGISTVISNFLSGAGKFKISAIGSGLALGINVTIGWFLVHRYAMEGAVVSMLIANLIQLIWLMWFIKNKILLQTMKKTLSLIFNLVKHLKEL